MSSLVFVRDAQGRPLMPMSAAYARTLIHQGKAQVWPHPSLSVIQLTRAVATPTLRPVLVGIALNTHIADLVIVVEQMRGSPSTIHIVVDLRLPLLVRGMQQGKWKPRRRRIPFTYDAAVPRPADYVRILNNMMLALHAIIPISHLVLLPSARHTALIPPHARWIEHRLATSVRRRTPSITLVHRHTRISGEAPYTLMQHLIDRTIWAARESPDLIAYVRIQHGLLSDQGWRARRSSPVIDALVGPYLTLFGQICTIRQQRRAMTGVVRALDPPDQLVLAVPVHVDDQGVRWQSIRVRITSSLQVWPLTPISVLPLAWEAAGRHRQ